MSKEEPQDFTLRELVKLIQKTQRSVQLLQQDLPAITDGLWKEQVGQIADDLPEEESRVYDLLGILVQQLIRGENLQYFLALNAKLLDQKISDKLAKKIQKQPLLIILIAIEQILNVSLTEPLSDLAAMRIPRGHGQVDQEKENTLSREYIYQWLTTHPDVARVRITQLPTIPRYVLTKLLDLGSLSEESVFFRSVIGSSSTFRTFQILDQDLDRVKLSCLEKTGKKLSNTLFYSIDAATNLLLHAQQKRKLKVDKMIKVQNT
jgi:hypothetical protein